MTRVFDAVVGLKAQRTWFSVCVKGIFRGGEVEEVEKGKVLGVGFFRGRVCDGDKWISEVDAEEFS